MRNEVYIISAVSDKSFNTDKEEEDEGEAKVESNKRRSSSETVPVSTTNVTRTGSVKEAHYHRDKSNEDVKESHEECKYLCLIFK